MSAPTAISTMAMIVEPPGAPPAGRACLGGAVVEHVHLVREGRVARAASSTGSCDRCTEGSEDPEDSEDVPRSGEAGA